jgi:hypothetical protein
MRGEIDMLNNIRNFIATVGVKMDFLEYVNDNPTGDDLRQLINKRAKLERELELNHSILILEELVLLDEKIHSILELRHGKGFKGVTN